ncbi:DUF3054 domain-containing protein [Halapricum desulfuricans]|uniref:Putative membrane protein n=1 Tax=Halapricum desulfuricans TaxID=2841257 RepID=A0A897N1W3_9EURY|nr:DUF3054 domain-containing protein [Halapricum desulfuricans]QSG08380.1 putative membrane protein [Halapricum desulfuricans]QSG12503.1 putative membrane protein [Halapricum desulfuricans]
MQVVDAIGRRVDRTRLSALVALGDVALLALFVTVGEVSHGTPPWEFPVRAVEALVPFLLGWGIAAFVGGLYTSDAWEFPLRAVSWTTPGWLTAVLIAMAIRSLPFVRGGVQLSFVAVSVAVGLVLLVPWRTTVALRYGR